MEEKKIIVPLAEWDNMIQENIHLKYRLEEERKKFQDGAQHCIVHWQIMQASEGENWIELNNRMEIHTNNDIICSLIEDFDEMCNKCQEKEKELEAVKRMSVWDFIRMKWKL